MTDADAVAASKDADVAMGDALDAVNGTAHPDGADAPAAAGEVLVLQCSCAAQQIPKFSLLTLAD
jgi:hypothetical protein